MCPQQPNLEVDPDRVVVDGGVEWNETGIYVRAVLGDEWGSYDIATLRRDSLNRWLRENPENGCRATLLLLGHRP